MRQRHWRAGWSALCALGFSVAALGGEEEIPYGTSREFVLRAEAGKPVLAVSAYLAAERPTFGKRRLKLAVNGRALGAAELLGPKNFYTPRSHPYVQDRVHEKSKTFWFPYTQRRDGLREFNYADAPEYDVWVPLYQGFSERVCFDLAKIVTGADGNYRVEIANRSGPELGKTKDGQPLGPAARIVPPELLAAAPPDDGGPFVPPVWHALKTVPFLAERAAAVRDDPQAPAAQRAQLEAQYGRWAELEGRNEEALRRYRRALELEAGIPEAAELRFRLEVLGAPAPEPPAGEGADRFGWARLLRAFRAAGRTGADGGTEAGTEVLRVPRADLPWRPEEGPALAAWERLDAPWVPLRYAVPGTGAEPAGNEFKLAHDETHLRYCFRGPLAAPPDPQDVPGVDRPVWDYDCAEFFVAPRARFTQYFELNVSRNHGRFDGRHAWNFVTGAEWNGAWESQVRAADGRLVIECRIPWADFGVDAPPVAGERWVANWVRVQHLAAGGAAEFSAGRLKWRSFHRLQDGLILRFD